MRHGLMSSIRMPLKRVTEPSTRKALIAAGRSNAPRKGSPNVLMILFDDVGFSDFSCYGSSIPTPTIDAIASWACAWNWAPGSN